MKKCAEAGFLLVEILVAVSVVALVLGTLMLAYSRSLKNAETAKRYQQAALFAEQKLWEYLWTDTLTEGISSGLFEDHPEMEWQSVVTLLYHPPEEEEEEEPTTTAEAAAQAQGPAKEKREKLPPTDLYQITVNVSWPEPNMKRDFELSTYTLVPVPEEEEEAPHVH